MRWIALVPRPQLVAAVLIGGLLLMLAGIASVLTPLVVIYHLVLAGLVIGDAIRLPARAGFHAVRGYPQPFSMGAGQSVTVTLTNPRAAGLQVEVADHIPHQLMPKVRVVKGTFSAEGRLEIAYDVEPPVRGAFPFGPVELRCWHRRGWWQKQVVVTASDVARVHPNLVAVREYQFTLRRRMPLRSGLRRARPPGATTAFAGLREYMPGDDIRRVNWKASARRDQPVVNEVESERGQQVMIALDCGRLMTAPAGHMLKLDHAINAALLLAWVAVRQGDRAGLISFSDRVDRFLPPRRGAAQMSLYNETLYGITSEYVEPDFGTAFGTLSRRVSRRSLVVVLTDILDAATASELVTNALWLAHRHLVLVVTMADPALLASRLQPIDRPSRAYEWAATEELLASRKQAIERLRHGGVLSLDVEAGTLSPALVERYLELKERAVL